MTRREVVAGRDKIPPAADYAIGVAHLGRRRPPKPSPGHIAREWTKRAKDAHWHVTSSGRRHLTIHVADDRTIHRRFTDANPIAGELT